jgi:segregation and condensation protein A
MAGVVLDADYRIKLQAFEGPLDLLLFLIRKNELDIYDIPIEQVTRQYLEAIFAMQELDLELAGEFFVMAASLMEIKSRMLLPKDLQVVDPNAADDEEMDPRWELVHQLIQYRKFKEAAARLGELAAEQQDTIARYVSALSSREDRPLQHADRIELWNVFNVVLRRLAEKLVVGEIHDEHLTVADQMEMLLARMQTRPKFAFSELFTTAVSLRTLVATFLAVLELTRLRRLRIRQDETFADILCEATSENELETPMAPTTVTA